MSGIQVSEQFLRTAARLMRQRDAFDDDDTAEDNRVWNEIMTEARGRIVMGLDQLTVQDFNLTDADKPWLDYVLEQLRSKLRSGEI